MKLLIVEDEEDLAMGLKRGLRKNGYEVEWIGEGRDGLALALGRGLRLRSARLKFAGAGRIRSGFAGCARRSRSRKFSSYRPAVRWGIK